MKTPKNLNIQNPVHEIINALNKEYEVNLPKTHNRNFMLAGNIGILEHAKKIDKNNKFTIIIEQLINKLNNEILGI